MIWEKKNHLFEHKKQMISMISLWILAEEWHDDRPG